MNASSAARRRDDDNPRPAPAEPTPAFPSFRDTAELIAAREPDLPSFLFSQGELRRAANDFKRGFDGLVTYAVKANPMDHIIETLVDEGLNAFDVASPDEMELIRHHAPGAAMHYNNPIRSRREIARAHDEFGVRSFAVDHADQLDQIAALVAPSRDIEITVRFKQGYARKAYDFGSKFGVMEDGAVELIGQVERMGFTPSLCFHVGSQCEEVYSYERHIAAAGQIAREAGITLARLNVGGGFPAAYASSAAPALEVYFETMRNAFRATFGSSMPETVIEPGRAMVTSSTSLLLRVKHQRGGAAVYLNDGAYGALMEVKFMPIIPPTRVWRDARVLSEPTAPFTIFGPTCDSYDALPQPFELAESIDEDDWVEFGQMGAYTQASTTSFNGFGDRDQFFVDDILI